MAAQPRLWRKFGVLFGMGVVGNLSLLPIAIPQIRQIVEHTDAALPSLPVLVIASQIQPLLLLGLAVAAGVRLAPSLHLRSHIAAWAGGEPQPEPRFRSQLRIAVGLGILAALVVLALDHFLRPTLAETGGKDLRILQKQPAWATIAAVLYGGMNEELLTRWGLATFLAWAIGKIRKAPGSPTRGVMWTAVVLAALVFAAGHLPAVIAMGIPLSGPMIARTLVLNAFAGVIFGWLYFRRSLESAMLAHGTVHITWAVLSHLV
ncbi:CPBP family intramembrane glutamic endopeptidase [Polyangium mundeleinium]|uniref:CPBP family intramembrane metalloprotease n=1 Tax=Polyangium mundeleinium TaxID=2995306 RepID=A0ABT5EPG8_9BACT|nr:CPBP family intramembrane glutamic endopeptidase [Polyangium mundeleinium]MDC0743716.1 CPBP family intramembrane metalloprotease [Polyangium mundeleinium]